MTRMRTSAVAAVVAAILTAPALGGIIITQGTSAPTYGTTLNFDEPGGPTGFVATDAWSASHGIAELQAGDGGPQVDDWTGIFGPWIGTGNSFFGNFGVFIKWENDLTEFSTQVWDPSGPPGPFGGGLAVFVFNDGAQVAFAFVEPAWGGIGDEWFDITTTDGDLFDEVRILGWGWFPTTFVDDLSWNAVLPPSLDIKPGSCPNPLNRRSHGVLPVAVVGSDSFDAMQIDASSVVLKRADGVGGEVAPNEGPPGPHSEFEDVATPFDGGACDCHEEAGDGITDLSMKFRTDDVVAALELGDLANGDEVELVVSGFLLDGTGFTTAGDCILIVPQGSSNARVGSDVRGTFVEVSPPDLNVDGSGFAYFLRSYNPGTVVTLTAPAVADNLPFQGWMIDGVMQDAGQTTIDVTIVEEVSVKAVYTNWSTKPTLGLRRAPTSR